MSDAVIQDICAAKDALYSQTLNVRVGELVRIPYDTPQKVERLPLPFQGTVRIMAPIHTWMECWFR